MSDPQGFFFFSSSPATKLASSSRSRLTPRCCRDGRRTALPFDGVGMSLGAVFNPPETTLVAFLRGACFLLLGATLFFGGVNLTAALGLPAEVASAFVPMYG